MFPFPGTEPGSPALQGDPLPSEPRGKATGKHREFQVKVLGSQHRLPLIGRMVLARQPPHIPDDFKDQVNSLYKGFSSVKMLSHVQLFVTPQTATRLPSLSFTNSRGLLTHVH